MPTIINKERMQEEPAEALSGNDLLDHFTAATNAYQEKLYLSSVDHLLALLSDVAEYEWKINGCPGHRKDNSGNAYRLMTFELVKVGIANIEEKAFMLSYLLTTLDVMDNKQVYTAGAIARKLLNELQPKLEALYQEPYILTCHQVVSNDKPAMEYIKCYNCLTHKATHTYRPLDALRIYDKDTAELVATRINSTVEAFELLKPISISSALENNSTDNCAQAETEQNAAQTDAQSLANDVSAALKRLGLE